MNCPNCGKRLTLLVDIGPESAPYACFDCARGWWPAELTPEARRLWNASTRSHGSSEAAEMIRLKAQVNRDVAVDRKNGKS